MNIERAILLVLTASPRAITATVIQSKLTQFTGEPHTLADVNDALGRLERRDPPQVKGTHTEDFGTLWKATDEGRLRVL